MEQNMNATDLKSDELELDTASTNGHEDLVAAANSLTTLKALTLQLLREVRPTSFENGLDFYDEVSRFEIDLIKRALLQTAGHQRRAAKLLNLNATTLNSKIKQYSINLSGFASGYPIFETSDNGTRHHV
jgi:DNA-binding NtrC family response regulator